LTDLSLALSAVLFYFIACSKMANGFKIGLTVLFIFTAIARCLCVALAKQEWSNNYCFIIAAGILFFELTFVASAS
jgi:K+ transporter